MEYLKWDEKTIKGASSQEVSSMYDDGYVFTRLGKGVMHQTRLARVDLSKFKLSSENKRILKKTEGVSLQEFTLPYADYDWHIGKLAKDFYENKFGPGIMSAQKIKEMMTEPAESNFNSLLVFSANGKNIGYCICYSSHNIFHYSYPFYDLEKSPKDMGLGMMTRAIEKAKADKKSYFYMGSLQRPSDIYKMQFEGFEWFDGNNWSKDTASAKDILKHLDR